MLIQKCKLDNKSLLEVRLAPSSMLEVDGFESDCGERGVLDCLGGGSSTKTRQENNMVILYKSLKHLNY